MSFQCDECGRKINMLVHRVVSAKLETKNATDEGDLVETIGEGPVYIEFRVIAEQEARHYHIRCAKRVAIHRLQADLDVAKEGDPDE